MPDKLNVTRAIRKVRETFVRGHEEQPAPKEQIGGVYAYVIGREFGSWIDGAGRISTSAEGDVIYDPAHIIESIFRDELGLATASVNELSFDEAEQYRRPLASWKFARSIQELDSSLGYVQELCEESGLVSVRDSQNKERLAALDYSAPLIGLTSADIADIGGVPQVRARQTPVHMVYNEFSLSYRLDYGSGDFTKNLFITASTDNLADNTRDNTDTLGATYQALCSGSQTRYNKTEKLTFEANWIRDDATAELFIKFLANWLTYRKWVVQATLRYTAQALALELMDPISWTLDLLPDAVQTDNAFLVTRLVDGGLAQRGLIEIEAMQVPSFFGLNAAKALALDGSTEYASKSSPSNLDMNGAETITDTDDRDFETDIGNWVPVGGVVLCSRTTTNPIVGTGSMLGNFSSGSSSRAAHYLSLPAAAFTTLVAGKKYTIEFVANSDVASTQLGVALGAAGQTTTSGVLTTTPGSGTKVVWNFTAASTDVGLDLRIWPTAGLAPTIRIDSVSITVAYDYTILAWGNPDVVNVLQYMVRSKAGDSGGNPGFYLGITSGAKGFGRVGDSTASSSEVFTTTSLVVGQEHLLALTVDRDGNLSILLDGILEDSESISSIGKIVLNDALRIGAKVGPANFFDGQIGEVQIIRGYAMTAAEILAYYNTGIKRIPPSGTVVAHYRWRGTTETEWLKDETGNNNLTGTNLARASDQVAADYAIFEG